MLRQCFLPTLTHAPLMPATAGIQPLAKDLGAAAEGSIRDVGEAIELARVDRHEDSRGRKAAATAAQRLAALIRAARLVAEVMSR
jgi:hypothetical protein